MADRPLSPARSASNPALPRLQGATPTQPAQSTPPAAAAKNTVVPASAHKDTFVSKPVTQLAAPDLGKVPEVLKDKLTSILWTEVTKARDQKLFETPLGNNGVFGIHAQEQLIAPQDAQLTGDGQRSAYEKAHTQPHVWTKLGGVMSANLGLSTSIPVGPASVSVGFSSSGSLQYSAFAPHDLSPSGVYQAAASATIDLPFTAGNAEKMAQGAEFKLRGHGQVGASSGVSAGYSTTVGPLSVGVTAGANGSVVASGDLSLSVKRLDGDKVYVRIGKVLDASASESVGVHGGASISDSAISSVTDLIPKNPVLDYLTGKATDAVQTQVNNLLSFTAAVNAGQAKEDSHVAAFTLDLSKPEARAAYEALMKLDVGPATALAQQGGAVRAEYDETKVSHQNGVDLEIGPAKLFLLNRLRTDRTGHLEGNDGTLDFTQATFDRSHSSIFGGSTQIEWEGMNILEQGEPAQTYFHLTFDKTRKATRDGDVDKFNRLAAAVNAQFEKPEDVHKQGGFFDKLFGGAYGKTEEKADIYFTRQGLQSLQNVSDAQVMNAFAHAAQTIDGSNALPAWSTDRSAEAAQWYSTYKGMPRGGQDDQEQLQRIAEAYKERFGRDIEADIADLDAAKLLTKQVQAMKGQPESEWAKAFANLGEKAGDDFMKHVAALSSLMGPDQTLVHELSINGDHIHATARDEGLLAGVDGTIGKALSPA